MNKINGKIVCVGRNYIEHIHELKNDIPEVPVIFMKNNSCRSSKLKIKDNQNLHYEVEMVFIFNYESKITGVGLGIDLTDRALQTELKKKGLPWELSKSFDNSVILSDFTNISDEDIRYLSFKAYKNNDLVQEGSYDLMINKPYDIVKFLNKNNVSLTYNDILMTGTPKGVGRIVQEDVFNVSLFLKEDLLLQSVFSC